MTISWEDVINTSSLDALTLFIEQEMGLTFHPSVSNIPGTHHTITFCNGIPKEEGQPIPSDAYAFSKRQAKQLVLSNIKRYIHPKTYLTWRIKPEYHDKFMIQCRIITSLP